MRKIVVDLEKWDSKKAIEIGWEGEVNATAVVFDISSWVKWYGKGNVTLIHTDLNKKFPYPCTIETVGNSVKWLIQPEDLTISPHGECQLIYSVGEKTVAKSKKFTTHVFRSLGNELSEPPQADKYWIDQVNSASVKAENAANQAEEAVRQVNQLTDTVEQKLEIKVTAGLEKIQKVEEETVKEVIAEGDRQIQRLEELIPAENIKLDDTNVTSHTAWSSEKIINTLCPYFEVSGSIVVCQPVEKSRLNILAQINPVQEGIGEPSPQNIRPISGWNNITIWLNDQPTKISLNQTVYGGILDLQKGILVIDRILVTLSGDESWFFSENGNMCWHSFRLSNLEMADVEKMTQSIASHYKYGINLEDCFWIDSSGVFLRFANRLGTTEEWKDYLKSENSSGHPVQVVYYMAIPIEIQLSPIEIYALFGVNTICADSGDITVSGYSDMNKIINTLAERIAALEQNAIGG